jgi:hypothetical protein
MSYIFKEGHRIAAPTGEGNFIQMAFSGRDVWATHANGNVVIYNYWGEGTLYQQETIDLSTELPNGAYYIVKGFDKMYVFDGVALSAPYTGGACSGTGYKSTRFVPIDINSKTVGTPVDLPYDSHCFPAYADGRLFVTTLAQEGLTGDDQQDIYYYTTTGSPQFSTSLVNIPGNKQFSPRRIYYAKESYLYVDSINENAVVKFDLRTGSPEVQALSHNATIITNRRPVAMYANDSKELIVGSADAMVTSVNQTTDTPTNIASTINEVTAGIWDDETYIWGAPTLVRVDQTTGSPITDNIRIMADTDKDYSIEDLPDTTFLQMIVTPTITHNEPVAGSPEIAEVTEPSYIVLMAAGHIYFVRDFDESWNLYETRNYYHRTLGTAMIATGSQSYYGETCE